MFEKMDSVLLHYEEIARELAMPDVVQDMDRYRKLMREQTDLPESMINDLVLMKLQAVGLRGAASLMRGPLPGAAAATPPARGGPARRAPPRRAGRPARS